MNEQNKQIMTKEEFDGFFNKNYFYFLRCIINRHIFGDEQLELISKIYIYCVEHKIYEKTFFNKESGLMQYIGIYVIRKLVNDCHFETNFYMYLKYLDFGFYDFSRCEDLIKNNPLQFCYDNYCILRKKYNWSERLVDKREIEKEYL